jgi:hypothetical protein
LRRNSELTGLIVSLLNHYWTANDLLPVREQQVSDWLDDLKEFPTEIVAEACRQWRRKPGTRRPLPGDIRALSMELHGDHLDRDSELRDGAWDEVEIMRRADAYARQHGFADIASFQRAGHSAVMWLPGGRRRRFPANKPGDILDYRRGHEPPHQFEFTAEELEDRAEWARLKDYPSWDDFLAAVQAGKESVLPFLDWSRERHGKRSPPPVAGFKTFDQAREA